MKWDAAISPSKMLINVFLQLRHLLLCHHRPSQQLAPLPFQILLEEQGNVEKTGNSVRWG